MQTIQELLANAAECQRRAASIHASAALALSRGEIADAIEYQRIAAQWANDAMIERAYALDCAEGDAMKLAWRIENQRCMRKAAYHAREDLNILLHSAITPFERRSIEQSARVDQIAAREYFMELDALL